MNDEDQPNIASRQDAAADGAIAEIEGTDLGIPAIPYYLVERHQNKTTKLLSNSDEELSIQAKNRWHDFDFSSPLFIGFVDIVGKDLSNLDEYQIRVKLEGGGKRDFQARPEKGVVRIDINEFCNSISFKPPSIFSLIFNRNPEIQRVSIHGFYKNDLGEFLYKISRMKSVQKAAIDEISLVRNATNLEITKLVEKEAELDQIDEQIAEAQRQIEILNASITEKQETQAEAQSKLDRADESLSAAITAIEERRQELTTVTTQRENEKIEIANAKNELRKLKEDINLFPSEIAGFASQASKDVKTYSIFIGFMIFVIVGLFYWVLTGAFDLSEYVKKNPTVNVWFLLLAKLPLAAVVSALVAASYKIARVFIEEMLRINRQKLSLTQVSIVAKDVSQAAESNLNLTDVEIYGLRIRAKMAMLADHIKTFIPSNPTELFPQNIFSVFDRSDQSPDVKPENESPLAVEGESGGSGANSTA